MKQLTTGPGIGSMISGAVKRHTPSHVITDLAEHETKHGLADKGPGEYGLLLVTATQQIIEIINNRIRIIKKEIEIVAGAFYRPIGERSAEVRKAIAQAPGFSQMSGNKNWGDWAFWYDADRELQQEEHANWLQQKFEESETNTLDDQNVSHEKDEEYSVDQPHWHTTSTQDFETEDRDVDQPLKIPLPQNEEENSPQDNQEEIEQRLLDLYHQLLTGGEKIDPEKWDQFNKLKDLNEEIIQSFYEPHFSKNEEVNQELIDDFFKLVNSTLLAEKPEEPDLALSQQNKHKQETTIFKRESR